MPTPESPPFSHERIPTHERINITPDAISYLEKVDVYDPSAPATQLLRRYVGEESHKDPNTPIPVVYLVKAKGIGGYTVGDAIFIHDGIFDSLKYAEECRALLEHEKDHYKQGETCEIAPSTLKKIIGAGRVAEIEADIRGLKALDENGINPLGMISLTERAVEQEAQESPSKGPHIESEVHGGMLERKVMLEQVLTVMDVKHLSPGMEPLERPELGKLVKLDDEAFWSLAPTLQQAQLNRVINRDHPSQRHIDIQKRILESIADQPEDEQSLRAKSELMHRKYTESLQDYDIDQLTRDLQILQSQNVRALMPRLKRRRAIESATLPHLRRAILDSSDNHEDLIRLADLIKETAAAEARFIGQAHSPLFIRMPLNQLLKDVDFSKLSTAQSDSLARKLIYYGSQVGYYESYLSSDKPKDEHSMEVPDTARNHFLLRVIREIDARIIADIQAQPAGLDKLHYLTKRFPGEAGDMLAHIGTNLLNPQIVGNTLHNGITDVIRKMPPGKLFNNFINKVRSGDVDDMRELASLVLAQIETNLTQGRKDRALTTKQLKAYLPFILLAYGGDEGPSEPYVITSVEEIVFDTRDAIANYAKRLKIVIEGAAKLQQEYPDIPWQDPSVEIRQSRQLTGTLLRDALKTYQADQEEGIAKLIALMQHYSVPRLEQDVAIYKSNQSYLDVVKIWRNMAESLISRPDLETDENALLTLAALGMSAPEVELNLTVADYAFNQVARLRDFEGGLRLLQEFPNARTVHRSILEVLIEEKAHTPAEFEQLNGIIETLYIDTLADNYGLISAASLADSIAIPVYSHHENIERDVALRTDVIEGMESSDLLAGLLSSGQDDTRLKRYLAGRWWLEKRAGLRSGLRAGLRAWDDDGQDIQDHFKIENFIVYRGPNKRAHLQHWIENDYPEAGSYAPFDDSLGGIYLLTDPARFFAVRKLLLQKPDGVLMNEQGGRDLVDSLMNSWLSAERDTEEGEILRELLHELVTKNDAGTAYLHIGPMLQDMILKPPKSFSDLRPITDSIADSAVDAMVARGRLRNPTPQDYDAVRRRVAKLFEGDSKGKARDSIQEVKVRILQRIGAEDSVSSATKLSTLAFAALAGKKAGGIGVKMLQLAGQYFELSEEDRTEFEDVYDDMKGQTRLQAYITLKREAAQNPATAELLDNIKSFGGRIGGGSLFTVYKVHLKDGREMALGVKNPNAEFRVRRLVEFASTGIQGTSEKHPKNTTLQLMSSLMDDAVQWVANELDDPEFPQKDAVYAQENDTIRGKGFKKGKTRYDVITPKTMETGTSWVRCEEFIGGTNLNSLHITEDGQTNIPSGVISRSDYKEAASVLVRNYVHQVMSGSYAHSDVHPGQFRITEDNTRIAIFDRRNLLPVHPKLRSTLRTAFSALMDDDVSAAALAIAMHGAPADTDPDKLAATIRDISQKTQEPARLVADTILALKRAGIKVPLDLSLMLRNFMSVNEFSKKAGFDNLAEAFLHTSSGMDELLRLAQTDETVI
ncbi:MAG TPA: AarF/UbiB family protein [Candidatus Saccharimonadales bacterium]